MSLSTSSARASVFTNALITRTGIVLVDLVIQAFRKGCQLSTFRLLNGNALDFRNPNGSHRAGRFHKVRANSLTSSNGARS